MTDLNIIQGNALTVLRSMESESVQMCVTSPPYWGLRDYGVSGQIGLEATPQAFIAVMVEIFNEVRRVLKKDGTCWINLGDSFFSAQNSNRNGATTSLNGKTRGGGEYKTQKRSAGDWKLKPKDLCGMPWRVAFALQEAGWWLRQDIIWNKPNPMPESATDRCTKAHEYIFLFTKSAKYFFDAEAIKEPSSHNTHPRRALLDLKKNVSGWATGSDHTAIGHNQPRNGKGRKFGPPGSGIKSNESFDAATPDVLPFRNKRSVWTVVTEPYSEAHFATFPPKLIEPCVLAGSRQGDLILDPFSGSGTTGLVALRHHRKYLGIELNPEYIEISKKRLSEVQVNLI